MENDANLDGGSMYLDASTEHNGVAGDSTSKENASAEKSTLIEDNTPAENNSLTREVVPTTDDLLQSSNAPQVEDAPGEDGAPAEVDGPAEYGITTENDTTNDHDAANKNEVAEEKEDAEGNGVSGQPHADDINGMATAKEAKPRNLKGVTKNLIATRKFTKGAAEKNPKNICEGCAALDLNIDRFIIQDHSSDRSQQAYKSYLLPKTLVKQLKFPLGSGSWKYALGTLEDIWARSSKCPFCFLVVKSLLTPHDELAKFTPDERKTICYVSWQVDGRELVRSPDGRIISSRPRTRRMQLHWDKRVFQDSYLVLVAQEAEPKPYTIGPRLGESDALFLGRSITGAGDNQALIKSWLDLCHASHGDMCRIERGPEFEDMRSRSYFGVVDVHEMRLTSLPPGQKYVALSYMWGKGKRYTTDLSNIQTHQAYGGLEKVFDRLPRVIQDTVRLVRVLGERYVWVDSLCIVQNSDRSWKLNAGVMDLVYGNAHLTICAAGGEGASTGLQGIMPSLWMTPEKHDTPQYIAECAPNVRLMVSHLAETYIERSKWNTRGWTFQERLLSKRCLIFIEKRVYFQCRSTAMSEDIIAEQKDAGWSIGLVQAPLQMLNDLKTRAFWVYANCVSLYTSRTLGRQKDILAAFNGMSNLIGNEMRAPLVFGLPSAYFDLALLWEAKDAHEPRRPEDKAEAKDFDGMKFPSWSWCGWKGTTMRYTPSTIGACLPNVHQWLTEHTWIHWYIRDEHGNLRPIWDGSNVADDCDETRGQWKGYSTLPRTDDNAHDQYGRILPESVRELPRSAFSRTLPEFPYRVSISQTTSVSDRQFPDQHFLQFWTWSAFLRVVPQEQSDSQALGQGLRRYDIADYTGDWCGTIVLNAKKEYISGSAHEFIAISEAKDFSHEENDIWTYYIPKEREQSDWDLYHVLLVEKTMEGVVQRVGLGKVFKEAFQNPCLPGLEWKEIILE